MSKRVRAWEAEDGTLFTDKKECDSYEFEHMIDIMIDHHKNSVRILERLKQQREDDKRTGAAWQLGYEEERNKREKEALKNV